MSTASEHEAPQATDKKEERPTITLTHVISTMSTGTFGGWGPKVNSSTGIIKSWN